MTTAAIAPKSGHAHPGAEAQTAEPDDQLLSLADEQLVIGEGVALDVRPAGFLLRAVSSIIDAVVVLMVFAGALTLFFTSLDGASRSGVEIEVAIVMAGFIAILVLVLVGVPVTIETLTKGRSLGRLAMGLRIVRDDGGAAGFRHALTRGLLGSFEIFTSAGSVAVIVGLMNPRAKRLGDLVAGTYCQQERVKRPMPRDLRLPPNLMSWAAVADVGTLPDRTARHVLEYLDQARRLEPSARQQLAESVGRECLPYVHPLPDVDADTFLRGVAAVRAERELAGWHGRAARRAALQPTLDALPHGFPFRG